MDCWMIFHYRLAKFRMSLGRTLPYWPLVLIPGSDTAPVGTPSTHKLLVAKWMAYFPHLEFRFQSKRWSQFDVRALDRFVAGCGETVHTVSWQRGRSCGEN